METILKFKISYLQNWYVQSNIVGENFEISLPEMPENISFRPPWFEKFWYLSFRNDWKCTLSSTMVGENFLRFISLKWLKCIWSLAMAGEILRYIFLECLKIYLFKNGPFLDVQHFFSLRTNENKHRTLHIAGCEVSRPIQISY